MNKAEALKMYGEIFLIQGEHNGRWEDEYSQEDSSTTYMKEMIDYAEKLDIDFDHDPKSYVWDNEEEELSYLNYDAMGYELRLMIEEKLRDIILA